MEILARGRDSQRFGKPAPHRGGSRARASGGGVELSGRRHTPPSLRAGRRTGTSGNRARTAGSAKRKQVERRRDRGAWASRCATLRGIA
ncbi:hypothetical protein [Burkholderia pseudomallei]|uniref:hypothetical protein n=1 Tax=Burkholderia pseudomallei TaxID=28450 RepID=UPI002D1FA135|nr:hypothetical protein [Burkholderia pseudomallei]